MGPPGHPRRSSTAPESHRPAEELDEEPQAQEEQCRDLHDLDENKNGQKGDHLGPREEQEIGSQYSSYCSAGPHSGDIAPEVEQYMDKRGGHAAEQVEDQITKVPQGRLHIVTEYVQVEHVAQKVEPTAVEEYGGKKRKDRIVYKLGRLGEDGGHLRGDNTENIDKLVQMRTEGQLEQKSEDIGPYENIGHIGERPGGDVVS